jgi:hypothetical protein
VGSYKIPWVHELQNTAAAGRKLVLYWKRGREAFGDRVFLPLTLNGALSTEDIEFIKTGRRRIDIAPILTSCDEHYESIRLGFFILRNSLTEVEGRPKKYFQGVIEPSRRIETHHGTTVFVVGKNDDLASFDGFNGLVRKSTVPGECQGKES